MEGMVAYYESAGGSLVEDITRLGIGSLDEFLSVALAINAEVGR